MGELLNNSPDEGYEPSGQSPEQRPKEEIIAEIRSNPERMKSFEQAQHIILREKANFYNMSRDDRDQLTAAIAEFQTRYGVDVDEPVFNMADYLKSQGREGELTKDDFAKAIASDPDLLKDFNEERAPILNDETLNRDARQTPPDSPRKFYEKWGVYYDTNIEFSQADLNAALDAGINPNTDTTPGVTSGSVVPKEQQPFGTNSGLGVWL